MVKSVFEIFKVAIGPSSSHTVGPMRAALTFAKSLQQQNLLTKVDASPLHRTQCDGSR